MEVPRGNLLTVDDGGRPRANSDPVLGTGLLLPEITVEDFTDPELAELHASSDQGGLFGMDATPRRRANTCPEDLFRRRNGRPPTPPPGTFRKGGRKFKSGFSKPVLKESVSFTHHKLSKLTESEDAEDSPGTTTTTALSTSSSSCPNDSSGRLGGSLSLLQCRFQKSSSESRLGQRQAERGEWREGRATLPRDRSTPLLTASSDAAASLDGRFAALSTRSTSDGGEQPSTSAQPTQHSDSSSNNSEVYVSASSSTSSSIKCRFSQSSKPRGLDSTQLQAC